MSEINYEFKKLHPFKWFILQNYPFLEDSIDALTNYELFCKLGEMINNQNAPINEMGEQVETLTDSFNDLSDSFNALNNYVTDFFKNLDVQDEIDNKLDEMAENGTLAEIIEGYATIPELTTRVENLESITGKRTIFIGDSYGVGTTNTSETIDSWIVYLKQFMGLDNTNSYAFAEGGAGFVATSPEGHNFKNLLEININSITDKDSIVNIIVCGGFNDRSANNTETKISEFMTYVKTQFPNAKVYIGMIGNTSEKSTNGNTYRYNLFQFALPSYKRCSKYGAVYLSGVENALKDYSLMSNDYQHPNANGYKMIASFIYTALTSGKNDFYTLQEAGTITLPSNATGGTMSVNTQRLGENTNIQISGNITFNSVNLNSNTLILGTMSSNYYRHTNHMNALFPCCFHLIGASTVYKTGFIRISGTYELKLIFDTTSLSGLTEVVIDYCSLSFPTIVS